MKLNSLNKVLAMTAAIGIAFVGISCKPKEAASGDAKEDVKKEGEAVKKDAEKAGDAVKKDAAEAVEAVKEGAEKAEKAVKDAVKKEEAK